MAPTGKYAKKRTRQRGKATLGFAVVLLSALIIGIVRMCSAPEPYEGTSLPSNPYKDSEFVMQNGLLTVPGENTLNGIDVSSHQGSIDWEQVADAGIQFAMIRVGYRGYSEGDLHEDTNARENYRNAGEVGLQRGVYLYSQAISPEEAREEAEFVLDFLEDQVPELPVVFDWEYVSRDARTGAVSGSTMTDCALAFCQVIRDAGLEPMIYFNQDLVSTRLDLTAVQDYGFWLAQYRSQLTFPVEVAMWQYTDSGTLPGIEGKVDMDLLFLPEKTGDFSDFSEE